MSKYPLIYRQIRRSGLVEQETLDEVYRSLYKNLSALYPESDSLSDDVDSETDFDLSEEVAFDDSPPVEDSNESHDPVVLPSVSFEEEMTRLLPAELELRGIINHWQASQLIRNRTRFNLGSYRMIDSLGMGGYGHVFLGRTQDTGSNLSPLVVGNKKEIGDVAIKVLPLTVKSENAAYKFLREAEINRDLKHPNIVRFIDADHDGNVHYMVHEYMDGGDVRELIGRQERLKLDLAVTIIVAAAQGLKYLHHRGLVHRDVKPGNILLAKNGDVKLIDLGLAVPRADKQFNSISGLVERLTQWEYHNQSPQDDDSDTEEDLSLDRLQKNKRKVAGTSDYISPDQIRIPHIPSPLWDIYSLGCSFYLMITGIVPFPAGNTQQKIQAQLYCDPPEPRMFCPDLPEPVSKMILAMMAKNAENRPQTMDEVIQSLRPWLTQDNVVAKAVRTSQLRPAAILKREPFPESLESSSENLFIELMVGKELSEVASFSAPPLSVLRNTTTMVPPPLLQSSPGEPVDKTVQMLTQFVLFPLIWVATVLLLFFLVLALLK